MSKNEALDVLNGAKNIWNALFEVGGNVLKNKVGKRLLFVQGAIGSTIVDTANGDTWDEQLVGIAGDVVGSVIASAFGPYGISVNIASTASGNSAGDILKKLYQEAKDDVPNQYYTFHKNYSVMIGGKMHTYKYAKMLHHKNGGAVWDNALDAPVIKEIYESEYNNYINLKQHVEQQISSTKLDTKIEVIDNVLKVTMQDGTVYTKAYDESKSADMVSEEKDDILIGGNQADILKGGIGFDTYYVGDKDVVEDEDGIGEVFFDDKKLERGKWDGKKQAYISDDGNIKYIYNEKEEILLVKKGSKTLTIKNYNKDTKNLGIKLIESEVTISIKDNKSKEGDTAGQSMSFDIVPDRDIGDNEYIIVKINNKRFLFGKLPDDPEIDTKGLITDGKYIYEWDGNTYKNEDKKFEVKAEVESTSDNLKAKVVKNGIGRIIDDDKEDDPEDDRRDPLAIDLNKNGVTSTSLDNLVYFDHDNNGFKEATGWIEKDDAFIALDKNGNGIIDNGNELFGDHTLSDTSFDHVGHRYKNGFEALKEYDTNKDNVLDENDEMYNSLLLRKDKNSNGISEEGELIKLNTKVKSIDLSYKESNFNENSNILGQISNATLNDDSMVGINDIWFRVNLDKTQEPHIQIPDDVKNLPQVLAFGNLGSLRNVMSSNQVLKEMVNSHKNLNHNDRITYAEEILFEWAGVSGVDTNAMRGCVSARKMAVYEKITGKPFLWLGKNPNVPNGLKSTMESLYEKFKNYTYAQIELQISYGDMGLDLEYLYYNHDANKYDYNFNGFNEILLSFYEQRRYEDISKVISLIKTATSYMATFQKSFDRNLLSLAKKDLKFGAVISNHCIVGDDLDNKLIADNINDSYWIDGKAGNDTIYGSIGNDVLSGNEGDDTIYGEYGDDTLNGGKGNDTLIGGGGNDTYIFGQDFGHDTINNYTSSTEATGTIKFIEGINKNNLLFQRTYKDGYLSNELVIYTKDRKNSITIQNCFDYLNTLYADFEIKSIIFDDGTNLNLKDIPTLALNTTENDDVLKALNEGSIIDGKAGNDIMIGASGNDILNGGDGDDYINSGYECYYLSNGTFNYELSSGDDIINGGKGNDTLIATSGHNTYIFGQDFGHDIIKTFKEEAYSTNTIKFIDGIKKDDLIIKRDHDGDQLGNNLIISTKDNKNSIMLQDFFHSFNKINESFKIDNILFDDGTNISLDDIKALTMPDPIIINASDECNTINGKNGDDILNGGNGNDTINSDKGDDYISGGHGDDMLNGSDGDDIIIDEKEECYINDACGMGFGNDILIGGKGDDTLMSIGGNDTYIFGKDFGHDTIYSIKKTFDTKKTIKFIDGIKKDDLIFKRDQNNYLIISTKDNKNDIKICEYADENPKIDNYFKIDNIVFDDGTSISIQEIKHLLLKSSDGDDMLRAFEKGDVINGKAGNDEIIGHNGDDILNGDEGDDVIDGCYGNDIINGGIGNDVLSGGYGDDTFIFKYGDGHDLINPYPAMNSGYDTIKFEKGIKKEDISFIQDKYGNLNIKYSNNDTITITDQINPDNSIEKIALNDGSFLTNTTLQKIIHDMNTYATDNDIQISHDNIKDNQDLTHLVMSGWGG